MKKNSLNRSLESLLCQGLTVATIVTDRHIGVNAMIKSDYPNTKHSFDAWHLAKDKDAFSLRNITGTLILQHVFQEH